MSQTTGKSLTLAEYSRKHGIPKYAITKNIDKFQVDPGFDTKKIIDNEENKLVASTIENTRQVRPNSKGKPKPRKKES